MNTRFEYRVVVRRKHGWEPLVSRHYSLTAVAQALAEAETWPDVEAAIVEKRPMELAWEHVPAYQLPVTVME